MTGLCGSDTTQGIALNLSDESNEAQNAMALGAIAVLGGSDARLAQLAEVDKPKIEWLKSIVSMTPAEYKQACIEEVRELKAIAASKIREKFDKIPAQSLAVVYGILTDKEEILMGQHRTGPLTQINVQINGGDKERVGVLTSIVRSVAGGKSRRETKSTDSVDIEATPVSEDAESSGPKAQPTDSQ